MQPKNIDQLLTYVSDHERQEGTTMRKRMIAMTMVAALALSGCMTNPTREDVGLAIGGALGGVLGSQVGKGNGRTAAIITGTLLGAAVGGSIGRTMDEVDRLKVAQVLETVPSRQPASWDNPRTGVGYTVTPERTYRVAEQTYCREYTVEARIGRRAEEVYGTACRQADGSWQIQ